MLETKINGVHFKNPVLAASGTFGYGVEYNELFDVSKLGGICSKGLTLYPREGNVGERMWECTGGLLNSVGLQNPGIPVFIEEYLPKMKKLGTVVIANLSGTCESDYLEGARLLNATDVDMIELNISCPNVKKGGAAFGIDADVAYPLVKAAKEIITDKPMIVKLAPDAKDIKEMASACVEAGADSLSLINTVKGMAIDIYKKRPVYENIHAGYSGPAIRPIALKLVYDVCKTVDVPVFGIGGISTWQDAVEFIMAGASAVQIGMAHFMKPDTTLDIINGLEQYCLDTGIKSLDEIRGCAL